MREDFKFSELSEKHKNKLLTFYQVDSLDDLEVEDNGNIILKKLGAGKKSPKVFIEDHHGKLHDLSIPEFIKKQKNPPLGFVGLGEEESTSILEQFLLKVLEDATEELSVLTIEHGKKSDAPTTLFQQLVIFYSNKLKSVLCGNKITEKYIHATGNPAYSDYDFYNILKKSGDLVIKGFAFASLSKKELFIDVVCGTGGTGNLIRDIRDNLIRFRGRPTCISLESIETVEALSFYNHLGFKKKDSDTLKLLKAFEKSKEKDFEKFARKYPEAVGGLLFLDPPKSYKATWIYDPIGWWSQVKKGVKPKLEAGGVGNFFKSIKDTLLEKVKPVLDRFKPKIGYTNQCKEILGKYGNGKVVKLVIIRQPILGVLDTILNTISFGTFQKAKEKYGYDKMFHLQLAAYTKVGRGTTKIVLEKNETVDMTVSTEYIQTGDKEFLVVPFEKDFTLNDLVETARKQQGDQKFFEYDAFKNNCQWFISYLLHGQELYGQKEKAFLFQDLKEFQKDLPKWLPAFSRTVTDLGATVSNLRGKAKRDFSRVRKPVENIVQSDKRGAFAQRIIDDIEAKEKAKVQDNIDRIQRRQNEANEQVRREVEGGAGERKYITPEEHAANRDRAIAVAEANKSRGVRWVTTRQAEQNKKDKEASEEAFKKQYTEAEKQRTKPKGLREYQAEEKYKKQKEKEQKEEDEQIATNAKNYKKFLEEQKKEKEEKKKKRVEELKEEFKQKQEQLKKDLVSYKEGRIDDIQNNELRSRAQTERNLGFKGDNKKGLSYYQLAEETYKNALRQQQEQDMLNIIPTVLQLGISKIPKVGDALNDIVDATGVKEDTSADMRRKAIIERGEPVRPDVVEGFEGEFPEPDFQDLAEKEGYGKPNNLHAIIINKTVPLEEAKKEAAKIIGNPKRKYFRETSKSYRFRNISKQKFEPKSFRTKVISPTLSLVFGNPKK